MLAPASAATWALSRPDKPPRNTSVPSSFSSMAIKHTPSQEAFNGANKLGDESAENRAALVIRTIGHSTRLLDEFLRLLSIHGISRVVDVRKMPRSRANPQFNIDTLGAGL